MSKKNAISVGDPNTPRRTRTLPPDLLALLEPTHLKMIEYFDGIFGPREEGRTKYLVEYDPLDYKIPKEVYNLKTVRLSYLRANILPELFTLDLNEIFHNLAQECYDKVFIHNPVRNKVATIIRRRGWTIKEALLDLVLGTVSFNVKIEGMARRSGIDVIFDIKQDGTILTEEELVEGIRNGTVLIDKANGKSIIPKESDI